METKDVCVATISLARNEKEEKALRDSLEQLAVLNTPVYITDGGSTKSFLRFLQSIPQFTLFEAKGLWPQAKMSITEAKKTGANFIFYTEPDKKEFLSKYAKRMLEEIIADERTGVVIASRSANGFATFPLFQQMTETTINNCCKEVIGKEIDYCYGPFFFNSKLIPFLEKLNNDIGWGWRPFLFAAAHRLGWKIESHEGDFNCPLEQRENEANERIYRMKQLTQNISGIIQAAAVNLFSENQ